MSGIVGFFNIKDKIMNAQEILLNMYNKISHRGLDKDGLYISNTVSLGHRLSLIHISEPTRP